MGGPQERDRGLQLGDLSALLPDARPAHRALPHEPLGRRTSYTVSQYPPGTQIGIDYKYCWFVRSEAPDGSIGQSYHVRMLWWMGLALGGRR